MIIERRKIQKCVLASIGYKILSYIMMMFVTCLTIIVIYYTKCQNIGADIFIVFIIVFFGFATFVVHYGKIIIDSENKKIVFYVFFWFKPQRYSFSFAEIKELILDEKIEEINVITLITTDKIIKFTGYKSLKGIKENLEKSRQIVETINMQINIR